MAYSSTSIQLDTLLLVGVDETPTGLIQAMTIIGGVPHHVTLLRVAEGDPPVPGDRFDQGPWDSNHDEVWEWFQGADPEADGPLRTLEVPGHEGEWCLLITPFCR